MKDKIKKVANDCRIKMTDQVADELAPIFQEIIDIATKAFDKDGVTYLLLTFPERIAALHDFLNFFDTSTLQELPGGSDAEFDIMEECGILSVNTPSLVIFKTPDEMVGEVNRVFLKMMFAPVSINQQHWENLLSVRPGADIWLVFGNIMQEKVSTRISIHCTESDLVISIEEDYPDIPMNNGKATF